MNAKQLLIKALKHEGADGLYCIDPVAGPCGCGVDDLCPCESILISECVAAKKKGNGFYPMEEEQ